MKPNYTVLAGLCLLASIPLVVLLLNRPMAGQTTPVVRIAAYNIAMNRPAAGELLAELRGGKSEQARKIAEIIQRNKVDVILLCELDRDESAETMRVFADEYVAVSQRGANPIRFPYRFAGPVNTGVPTGMDLDGDGATDGPGDAFGFGRHPGQYGMAVLSRHPILVDEIRTFQMLKWSDMPGALRPEDCWPDDVWSQLRLSSKSHWDVPVGVGDKRIHLLCSHPTPPVFDGPEDRNGCRNHDEIRFWVDYLNPLRSGWIVDDAGKAGGLPRDADFVILGDLNCDPVDGDARREALLSLLSHPRVLDPEPRSEGAREEKAREWGANATHKGDPSLDTGDFDDVAGSGPGNLRVDYVLLSSTLESMGQGVYWPLDFLAASRLVEASDHCLVWVDVAVPKAVE